MDDPKPAGTIISLKDVEVFQDSNLILSQVNLNIDKGEFVFLVGKTGSGKSSLLRTLYADVSPAGGSAEICGYNLMKHCFPGFSAATGSFGKRQPEFCVKSHRLEEKGSDKNPGKLCS
jgi:ABC-type multidrug transport system ATPase subunit